MKNRDIATAENKAVKKKNYIAHNKKIDSIDEVFDTTIDVGKKVGKKVEKKSKAFWFDFKKFVAKGNVVDLAIAVVVGTAFNKIVNTLVSGIITPLTGLLLKTDNLSDLKWIVREAVEANEEQGIKAVSALVVAYGTFLQAIIDFMVIALSIYVALKVFMKLKNTINRKEREAAEKLEKEEAERKKAEAKAEALRQEQIKKDFLEDVAVQADVLNDIKVILLRMEQQKS